MEVVLDFGAEGLDVNLVELFGGMLERIREHLGLKTDFVQNGLHAIGESLWCNLADTIAPGVPKLLNRLPQLLGCFLNLLIEMLDLAADVFDTHRRVDTRGQVLYVGAN